MPSPPPVRAVGYALHETTGIAHPIVQHNGKQAPIRFRADSDFVWWFLTLFWLLRLLRAHRQPPHSTRPNRA
jgi:hypothetical protein